jgi:hypothetical protein
MAQMVDHLFNKHKALSSTLSTTLKEKSEEEFNSI